MRDLTTLRQRIRAIFAHGTAALVVFLVAVPAAGAVIIPHEEVETTPLLPVASPRAAVSAATLGEQVVFNIEPSFDRFGRSQISTTLRRVGTRSLIYVEDAYFNGLGSSERTQLLDAVSSLGDEFDGRIYPILTDFYGPPWEPGIDGDTRSTILLTEMVPNAGGYFATRDEFPRSQEPRSNEREMFYLNVRFYTNVQKLFDFGAHEFTHLIDFYQKAKLRGADEEVWMNELRAEYALTPMGYDTPFSGSNLESRLAAFLSSPTDSITEWKNAGADYGHVNIFAHYLAGHYGDAVLKEAIKRSSVGIASIDESLAALGKSIGFLSIFQEFSIANFINSSQPGSQYAYTQPELSGSTLKVKDPTVTLLVDPLSSASVSRSVKDWAGQWVAVVPRSNNGETMVIDVEASVPFTARAILERTNGALEVRALSPTEKGAIIVIEDTLDIAQVVVVPVLYGKTSGFFTGSESGTFPDEPLRSYTVSVQRVKPGSPVITGVSPSKILARGGSTVTVEGLSLSGSTVSASIDGQPVDVLSASDTALRFVSPPHSVGGACLTVTVDGKSDERCDLIEFVAYPDGSLIRASGRPEVWIVQGGFRRHILSSRIFDFYGHLSFSAVRDVPQEVVDQFRVSAWVRLFVTADPVTWRIYEVNADLSRHWITCADSNNCESVWRANGGDPAGVYTINGQEMNFYPEGAKVFLR